MGVLKQKRYILLYKSHFQNDDFPVTFSSLLTLRGGIVQSRVSYGRYSEIYDDLCNVCFVLVNGTKGTYLFSSFFGKVSFSGPFLNRNKLFNVPCVCKKHYPLFSRTQNAS